MTDRIVVKPKPTESSKSVVASRIAALGGAIAVKPQGVEASRESVLGDIGLQVVKVDPAKHAATLNELAASPDVRMAAPVYRYWPSLVPNDPSYTSQVHHRIIGSAAAWDITTGAPSIVVAICDTGVDSTHPDLAGVMLAGYNFNDGNGNTADVEGHGTAVAGTAAAIGNNGAGVAGVTWKSRILPVRISAADGSAYSDTIAAGIKWAADQGAKVINCSFGPLQGDSVIENAAAYAHSKGSLVFVAAGNEGTRDPSAQSSNIIFVSATDPNDVIESWSNTGPAVKLSAPGDQILTTTRGGGYSYFSGTSFSSPICAGAAALLWSAKPSMSNVDLELALENNAKDLGTAGYDNSYGWGRVDVAKAINAVAVVDAAITSPAPGTKLTGSTVTFNWTAGRGVDGYYLYVGTAANPLQYYASDLGTARSATVSGLPTDGSQLKVWLYSRVAGRYNNQDVGIYFFNASGATQDAQLTSPAPGSQLSGPTVTFTWSSGTNVSGYYLYVGTSSNQLRYFYGDMGQKLSATLNNIPVDGSPVRVWIYSKVGGAYNNQDVRIYDFTTSGAVVDAQLTAPAANSKLPGTSVTFTWTAGTGVAAYYLYVGTATNPLQYFGGELTTLSQTVNGLPIDGSPVKVWLYSKVGGSYNNQDVRIYSFTGAGGVAAATITSPLAGARLSGPSTTITWSTGSLVSSYYLYVGTPSNPLAYFAGDMGTATSKTITNLPTDGSTVKVWVYSKVNGTYNDQNVDIHSCTTGP